MIKVNEMKEKRNLTVRLQTCVMLINFYFLFMNMIKRFFLSSFFLIKYFCKILYVHLIAQKFNWTVFLKIYELLHMI